MVRVEKEYFHIIPIFFYMPLDYNEMQIWYDKGNVGKLY